MRCFSCGVPFLMAMGATGSKFVVRHSPIELCRLFIRLLFIRPKTGVLNTVRPAPYCPTVTVSLSIMITYGVAGVSSDRFETGGTFPASMTAV